MTLARVAQVKVITRPIIHWGAVFRWLSFIRNSAARHRRLGAAVFLVGAFITVVAAASWPRRYRADTRMLARPVAFMSSLTTRRVTWGDETPTRAAREAVLSKDSLKRIAQDADLVSQWQEHRGAFSVLRDRLRQLFFGAWTKDEWLEIVVGTLQTRLTVLADYDTIDIKVDWSDPFVARQIVEAATQNFVETKHTNEVASITEAIGILEIHASQTSGDIDEAVEILRQVVSERTRFDAPRAQAARAKHSGEQKEATPQELAQLKFTLLSKERSVSQLEQQKSRTIAQARAELEQQRVIYNRAHPALLELERKIDDLKRDSPQLKQLKHDVQELRRISEEKTGKPAPSMNNQPKPPDEHRGMLSEGSLANLSEDLERDPAIQVAQDQVRGALAKYQELLMRIETAKLALDTTRAALKFQFHVVRPPQTAKSPISPNVPLVVLIGFFLSAFLAIVCAVVLDLWKRALCEPWQIEEALKIKVLVTLHEPLEP